MQREGAAGRLRAALRVALSHYITNGMSVAFGLLLISAGVHFWLGAMASSAAAVGVIVASPPDLAAPTMVFPTPGPANRATPTRSRSSAPI